jgi:hypothetical protein
MKLFSVDAIVSLMQRLGLVDTGFDVAVWSQKLFMN